MKIMKAMSKTIESSFEAVKYMRQQRDRLSEKLSKMTKSEIIEYFNKHQAESIIKPSA